MLKIAKNQTYIVIKAQSNNLKYFAVLYRSVLQSKFYNLKSSGRNPIMKRGLLYIALIRPLSIMRSGYPRYFGS